MSYHGVTEKDERRRFASEGEAMCVRQDIASASYGCIFCKTGREMALVKELSEKVYSADFLVAQKKSRRRINGKMIEETVVMFPGYIFFRTLESVEFTEINKMPDVLKLLSNGNGEWKLLGDDYRFVDWVFSQGGIVGFSKALVIGERLRILRGPLVGFEGQIIKVNRRFQNCLVVIRFKEREFKVWLGYELT